MITLWGGSSGRREASAHYQDNSGENSYCSEPFCPTLCSNQQAKSDDHHNKPKEGEGLG
jgi:hypothetical protein